MFWVVLRGLADVSRGVVEWLLRLYRPAVAFFDGVADDFFEFCDGDLHAHKYCNSCDLCRDVLTT